MGDATWRRVAGLRVVMSWPDTGFSSPPPLPPPGTKRARFFGIVGAAMLLGGAITIGVATLSQQHAPQPSAAAAGNATAGNATSGNSATGNATARNATSGNSNAGTANAHREPSLRRSTPVSISVPSIGVHSKLLHLGLNSDGTIQVPALPAKANLAAWYKHSATPGQIGTSVIEGHVDSYAGPAVFFRLGALRPGDTIDVTLADGVTAIFRVTGVREYPKVHFPARAIYGTTNYAALRLITCGGTFDYATGHYLSSTVVFASLAGHRTPDQAQADRG
ncbi:MAG: class F sortase [Nocardiopsaceae bacterium]|nr:class F sortase [Nocardiopsaceae bacterium]